jgi:hypothetical protein
MSKSDAQAELAAIVAPINARDATPSATCTFGEFVEQKYLPFYRRKWKRSTALTSVDRLKHHLVPAFRDRTIGSLTDEELQDLRVFSARVHDFGLQGLLSSNSRFGG